MIREGFYENETLEQRLLRLADEWESLTSRETCQCEDNARYQCANDLRHVIQQTTKQVENETPGDW
jgi:hypothetical protein